MIWFLFTRYYIHFVMCHYLLHLQIASSSLAAIVMFGNILAAELWTFGIVFLMLL